MTQYDDEFDYTKSKMRPQASGNNADDILDVDLSDTSYDDMLDDPLLDDDASWDDPAAMSPPPRKAMKSGKTVKSSGKKTPLFNIILIAAAAIVGLGILFFQFSGGKTPAPTALEQPQITAPADPNDLLALQQTGTVDPNAAPPAAAATDPLTQAPAPSGGILDDPSLLPQVQPAPAPTAATTEQPAIPTIDTPTPALPAPEMLPEQVAPAPSAAPLPAPEPTPIPAAITPAEPAPAPAATPTPAPAISDTVKPAESTKTEMGMTSIPTADLESLKANLAALEAKVKSLEEQKTAMVTAPPADSQTNSIANDIAEKPKKKTTAKKKPAAKPKAKKPAAAKTPSWELRGIAGGSAIIAKRGSDEFQTISVGDQISGIGRVTSITNQNGAWVVKGTSGSIRQ